MANVHCNAGEINAVNCFELMASKSHCRGGKKTGNLFKPLSAGMLPAFFLSRSRFPGWKKEQTKQRRGLVVHRRLGACTEK